MMNRLLIRILLVVLILLFAAMACVNGGDGSSSSNSLSGEQGSIVSGLEATATFGAEQFHLQLTAISESEQ
jgi:hypothetical protein